MKNLTAWTNNETSYRVLSFKSALALRKGEAWAWSTRPTQVDWWVIDGEELSAEIQQTYIHCLRKPKVVIIDAETGNIPVEWLRLTYPMNLANIFSMLDDAHVETSASAGNTVSNAVADSEMAVGSNESTPSADNATTPWKQHKFRLKAWPNVAKYSAQSGIITVCSKLLTDFADYKAVQTWGVENTVLDDMLSDAYRTSLLILQEEGAQQPVEKTKKQPLDDNLKIIQSLLQRFL